MNQQDAAAIIAIATKASMADGTQDAQERTQLTETAERLGVTAADMAQRVDSSLQQLADSLSSADARQAAYDVAVAMCSASGSTNSLESAFLRSLGAALHIDTTHTNAAATTVLAAASAPTPATATTPNAGALDQHILDQAMLTAALELLPDRLANIAIVPLQLRLVKHIGTQAGQPADLNQIKDLAGAFGIGAAAQVMERVIRKAFGGIAGGLLGGLLGGTAGVAAGGAVTFASTYALGHAAKQYYAQGRSLSTADLKSLFTRFQDEAKTMYPKVQDRISTLAKGNSVASIMKSVTS